MIRKYQPADCEPLLNAWERASAMAHPFLSEDFMEQERRAIPEVYLPNAETWVWEADGQVLGFISLLGHEIGGLFVDPDHHRLGIGRKLIDKARSLRGDLEVEVFEKNLMGRAFYEKMGFEPMQRKVHDQTGFEILRLRLAGNAAPVPDVSRTQS